MDILIVVLFFNEEEFLLELEVWICWVMEMYGFFYEIVFVDDGSWDGLW